LVYTKVIHCSFAKEIWDKLQNIYEEDSKVKETKLQTCKGQLKQLKMKKDENIAAYFLQVDETMNAIIGLGEEFDESVIVQKVLRPLPLRFDPKISTLEKRVDLDSIRMDEIHGISIACEMRTEEENSGIKEVAFKSSKSSKKKGNKNEKEYRSNSDISKDDEEVSNFVRRLKKGTNGRYKGNITLICFNYDGIDHFSNKCPHKKNKIHEEVDANNKQTYKGKGTKNNVFKKWFFTKEDCSSSEEDEVSESETKRVIFMEIEDSDK
jgi:hypothetical protein